MNPTAPSSGVNRRVLLSALALLPVLSGPLLPVSARAQTATASDLLPSWSDGPAKQAILDFVRTTIDRLSPSYVLPEDRIAAFDQDGTLWVEHPMYTQVVYCLERVPAVVAKRPELRNVEPFKTVLSGSREAIARLSMRDLEKILVATLTGMPVEEFNAEAKTWLETARDPRWKRPYTALVYQPMLEVLRYLHENAYKTYIVTGGGQDFVRVYAEKVYGIPPEQVVGTAGGTKFGYAKDGKPFLTKDAKLLLNDNNAGKPEGIHLMIGRRPYAAFGNSTGDRQMLEWTGAGSGARLKMLVLHDDAAREYAYGPAQGLPDTKVGTFTQALYDEAKKDGWTVISMKNDWAAGLFLREPSNGGEAMKASAALVAAALCLGVAPAQAGPCTAAIAQFEQAVRQSAGNPDAGPMARQSIGAQLDRQPTPGSVKRAEERAQTAFTATLARAKRLDARGDRAGCKRALAAAKRMYNF